MKHKSTIISIAVTLVISFVILASMYYVLAVASEHLLDSGNKITKMTSTSNSSYLFYSQTSDDLELFPWNYYEESQSLTSIYGETVYLNNFINTDSLYSLLTYHFYKCIPYDKCQYLYDNKISLKSLIDYDNFYSYVNVNIVDESNFYFYIGDIMIDETPYTLSFSFDEKGTLLSFNVKQSFTNTEISSDIIEKSKNCLSSIANEKNSTDYLALFCSDMLYYTNSFDNYTINITPNVNGQNKINYYFSKDTVSTITQDFDNENEYITFSDKNSSDEDSSTNITKSYQIIETKDELLVVLLYSNTVLHFDPVNLIFTGYNNANQSIYK